MHERDPHDTHRWEDDGGRPGCLCRGDCPATQAERDAAARTVVHRHAGYIDEGYTPHFGTLPAKPHCELPDGETYRRAIDGG